MANLKKNSTPLKTLIWLVMLCAAGPATLRSQGVRILLEGCTLCPSGVSLEFPAEYLSFSLDSLIRCRDFQKEWYFTRLIEPLPVRLRCGALYRTFFIEPQGELKVVFAGTEKGFSAKNDDALNMGYARVNAAFDSLLQNYTAEIVSGKGEAMARHLAQSLKAGLDANPVALMHLHYTMGHFLLATGSASRTYVYREYLAGRPLLWKSEAYGMLFRDFYEDLLQENLARRKYENLARWLKSGGSWRAVDSALATLPFFEDSALRYPAFALGLLKLAGVKDFAEAPLYLYITEILSKPGVSPPALSFFKNILKHLRPPEPALYEALLTMKVTDTTGQNRALSSLSEGKAMLLAFCDPFSLKDMEELRLLPSLEKYLKGRLKTVAILLDGDARILREAHVFLGIKMPLYRPAEVEKLRDISRGRPYFLLLYDAGLRFLADDLPPLSRNADEVITKKLGG